MVSSYRHIINPLNFSSYYAINLIATWPDRRVLTMPANEQNDYRIPPKTDACELCKRAMETLTKHHLIPRTRHRKKRNKRLFERVDVRTRILWVCRPCHNHIHDVFTEKELEEHYNTSETLLAHPEIERFVVWIKDKPAGFKPTSRTMKR